jgi:PilZ domain
MTFLFHGGTMKEQRLHPRVPLRLEVRWNGSQTRPGITTDISKGGCYVESLVQVTTGDVFLLELQLAPGQSVELECEVRYVHPTIGFGVRFRYLTDVQLQTLLQLIASAQANQNPTRQIAPMTKRGPRRVAA